ncbi:MAG: transaldolase [Anaerolinea sp.]|nr:transaldolase [Anaerolinea sp.]
MSTPIQQLTNLGQSLWYDNIQRRLLAKSPKGENSEFATMIARGDIRGVTSNPSIFNQAIAKSNDYDSVILPLAWSGWDAGQIFWQLAIEDIRAAADLFLPLYNQSEGADGYVSLEVSPYLAHDTQATLEQARHLWQTVNRPNLMIKIPATKEGLPAIRQSIAAGININVTLIFSIQRYKEVMEAYLNGLEERLLGPIPPAPLPYQGRGERGVGSIASVASFFISRVDTKVDGLLPEGSPLRGKAAIANSKLAYDEFRKVFNAPRFAKLQMAGCRIQRPLWASTSTKNPAYPDTLYVDELIGPATVNTVPPQTLAAFRAHGKVEETLMRDLEGARQVITGLEAAGISMVQVMQELEDEGVKAFADAYMDLLKTIDDRRRAAVTQLGPLPDTVKGRVASLEADSVPQRLQDGDPTLWTTDPQGQEEVRKRMGWLRLPETSPALIPDLRALAAEVRAEGFSGALLLGMGGSSLAAEVYSLTFPKAADSLNLLILDSTDPAQVLARANAFPPDKTLYIVSSKSGGTAEVKALFDYFWERCGHNGKQFVAITDPGTSLEDLAKTHSFRRRPNGKIFLADANVGGRYSALTAFGLLPAALLGIDLERLLERADWMARQCAADVAAARNPGLVLGAILGQAALDGRDKLTFIADEDVAPLGAWLEQLVAESSGKQGKGILPVDGEPLGDPADYGEDRLFVYLRSTGAQDAAVNALRAADHPVLEFLISDFYSLGAEIYRWEYATAVACHILGVNAFDQPDVQDSKDRTKAKIAEYQKSGKLEEGILVEREEAPAALKTFLTQARTSDYVAINAYLPRNAETSDALQKLRKAIREKTACATTVGFGPRFLHSTGQLHKGGPDTGLFLQITAEPGEDIEIPTQGMTFGVLERAQALGDYEALAARERRILRVHLPSPEAVSDLAQAIK